MVAVLQLPLIAEDDQRRQRLLTGIAPDKCRISRFNTRKERDPEHIRKLAGRMIRNGFELTRAVWAYEADDGVYEVFAGGTRLEAARLASVRIAVVLHDGYTWEEIARLTDQDNENDEYHTQVRPMDVWAEYARLRDVEGWTQTQIAEAKGVSQSLVSERQSWHELPDSIKQQVGELSTSVLTERHLREVFVKYLPVDILSTWADIPAWRIAALEEAIAKKQSSRNLADRWQERKAAVERANELVNKLLEGDADEYVIDGDTIARVSVDWRAEFAAMLVSVKARTPAAVDTAFAELAKRSQASQKRKAALDAQLDAKQQTIDEEADRIREIEARWHHGDCLDYLPILPDGGVRLLLTDPPYGVDFQSNRRVVSAKADKIVNDDNLEAALRVFGAMLAAVADKLADDAHLLVFTSWQVEPSFRAALEKSGYTVRGSLVWVKENHTSGDLTGSFAPRHERILHATKGKPTVSPRVDDVLEYPRESTTDHPTEKPTALLARLIECTTQRGDLVIDPFAGTGAVCVAAKALGREYNGCELDEHYWQQGFERLRSDD